MSIKRIALTDNLPILSDERCDEAVRAAGLEYLSQLHEDNRERLHRVCRAAVLQALQQPSDEIEKLRMQLAACGVAAMQNTRESAKERIGRDNPYWSESYNEVCKAVDREMLRREQLAALQQPGWVMPDDWRLTLAHAIDLLHEATQELDQDFHDEAVNVCTEIRAMLAARPAQPSDDQGACPQVDIAAAVNRFLGWPLPRTFAPDCGIKFTPLQYGDHVSWPIGTNLFTATEARAMFEHALGACPQAGTACSAPAADTDSLGASASPSGSPLQPAVSAAIPNAGERDQ